MAGAGVLSDEANRTRARSLLHAKFRRMQEQALVEQLPLGAAPPRARVQESGEGIPASAASRGCDPEASEVKRKAARSGSAFAEKLDELAARGRRRKREAAAARRSALQPQVTIARKASTIPGARREGNSLHFDVDEDSVRTVAEQLRDALAGAAVRAITTYSLLLTTNYRLLTASPLRPLVLQVRVIDLFRDWDDDGNGMVTRREFHKAMADLQFNVQLCREVEQLSLSLQEIQKGSHKHFMLKEIMEQPEVLENCMRGRLKPDEGVINMAGVTANMPRILDASRIIICACGTSWHAGLVGEYLIETLARVPVEVEYASEFRYRRPILYKEDVMIAISQSGETADTLAAIQLAKQSGCFCLGVCNTVGSSIARETDAGVYLHAGPEIGVASTKAFTAQVLTLTMIALKLASERKELGGDDLKRMMRAAASLPELMRRLLATEQLERILQMARTYRYASNFLYLGRGFNFPVALEGALKLKEISYIHAEGYPAAEMKHGPIALIDQFMPVVVIAPRSDPNYLKLQSNIQEVLARGGAVIAITEEGNDDLDDACECVIKVPVTEEFLTPLLCVVPLQLLAYYIADMRRCNVDQPRNLAKSVTVE